MIEIKTDPKNLKIVPFIEENLIKKYFIPNVEATLKTISKKIKNFEKFIISFEYKQVASDTRLLQLKISAETTEKICGSPVTRTVISFVVKVKDYHDCGTKIAQHYHRIVSPNCATNKIIKEGEKLFRTILHLLYSKKDVDKYLDKVRGGDFVISLKPYNYMCYNFNLLTTCKLDSLSQINFLKKMRFKRVRLFNNPNYGIKKDRAIFFRECQYTLITGTYFVDIRKEG